MKLTFEDIKDFDDFERWVMAKSNNYNALEKQYEGLLKHSKELEAENYELQMENMKLKSELEQRYTVSDMDLSGVEIKNATATNSDE